jgi:RNA-directed DNA polymerase
MKCRAMQALSLLALDPGAETTADPNTDGVRPQRSTADAREQCCTALGTLHTAQWRREGDIKACVDGISHEWLFTPSPMEKAMLRKWLTSGYREENGLYPTEEGTPQGGSISPVRAQRTLDGRERG